MASPRARLGETVMLAPSILQESAEPVDRVAVVLTQGRRGFLAPTVGDLQMFHGPDRRRSLQAHGPLAAWSMEAFAAGCGAWL